MEANDLKLDIERLERMIAEARELGEDPGDTTMNLYVSLTKDNNKTACGVKDLAHAKTLLRVAATIINARVLEMKDGLKELSSES